MSEVTIPANPNTQMGVQIAPGADADAVKAHAPTAASMGTAANYHNGRLTLDGMRQIIARGGSVTHNGNVINDVRALPSETQLARDNAAADRQALIVRRSNLSAREQQAHAAGNYDLQKPELDAEKAAIDREAARITTATAENEQDALASVQRRRAELDAEEAQLKAAQASKPVAKK